VTYGRALLYEDKLPAPHNKWTPHALLAFLVEMDPEAELATNVKLLNNSEQPGYAQADNDGQEDPYTGHPKTTTIHWSLIFILRPKRKILSLVVG